MDNPYSPPKSDVEIVNTSNPMHLFKRFSAWWVFLLTIVTFGIYPVYWLYSRSQVIGSVHRRQISEVVVWGTILVFIPSTVLSYMPENTIPNQEIFSLLSTLVYLILYLWWLFAVRNRLLEMVRESGDPKYRLSPIMTFFFYCIYLQYKINEQIDQMTAETP
jgi:hypothetical protein